MQQDGSDNETVVTKNSTQTFDNVNTSRKTILATIKIKLRDYCENNNDYMNEGIELIVDLLNK